MHYKLLVFLPTLTDWDYCRQGYAAWCYIICFLWVKETWVPPPPRLLFLLFFFAPLGAQKYESPDSVLKFVTDVGRNVSPQPHLQQQQPTISWAMCLGCGSFILSKSEHELFPYEIFMNNCSKGYRRRSSSSRGRRRRFWNKWGTMNRT